MSHTTITPGQSRRGVLALLVAACSWGTIGITTRTLYGISMTDPVSIGFLRLALAAPFLSIACCILLGKRVFRIARRDLALMILLGAMEALYQACYFTAITFSGVAVSTLVTLCTAPVLVAVFSVFVNKERLGLMGGCALLCATSGTWLLVGGQHSVTNAASLLGIMFALGSAVGYALVILCARPLSSRYHPLHSNAIGFTTGAVLLLGVALNVGVHLTYPVAGWLLLGYLGVVPTAIAYGLFMWGMRSTPATVASMLTLCEPLTATVLAWIVFGEQLGPSALLGGCLLLAAIVVISLRKER